MNHLIQHRSKQPLALPTVSYAQSLRAIGQALETLRLHSFELRKNDDDYALHVRLSAVGGKVKTFLQNSPWTWNISRNKVWISRFP